MQYKKLFLLGLCLGALTLAACEPKGIDDSDLVSVDYKYTLDDGTIIEQGTKDIIIGTSNSWIEPIIMGAKLDDEFTGIIDGNQIYGSEYNSSKTQSFAKVILTDVIGIDDPKIGAEVTTNTMGDGKITKIEKDEDGYDAYVVDFNDPKTYSDLLYYIRITNVEKL